MSYGETWYRCCRHCWGPDVAYPCDHNDPGHLMPCQTTDCEGAKTL